jgi:hypothetical protein
MTTTTSRVEELVRLCDEVDRQYSTLSYRDAQEAQKKTEAQIREIGQELFDEGGEPLMVRTCQDVAGRSRHGRYLEGVWNGIGTWLG